ncbi:3-(3-hydroxyphenyl)propionate hydroxylase [Chryseobacterium sp. FH2]|uniref:FAD-dependent monooxygenase n=1 Tax=Chryseobacterium sp. FH2 TaxID=1674291 RepID=UPI00065AB969|nr:FAD-dependent monooxygenase [Chryseobacterium sp. FH2]KMQ68511.1 3-(3-hydroxyphenyl)propionate hydroxylase [Chryseobacterium sp. FH2]
MNITEKSYDVIVAGAGPTGLMLACELKLMGANVAIIERRAHGTTGESRAPGINARSMEAFRMRGLAEEFEKLGKALRVVLFSGVPMNPKALDPDFPDALILPQHQTERLLTERAIELGVEIYWATELLYFNQDKTEVKVFAQQNGEVKNFSAKYLAGCDGGNSIVRRLCGESFTGEDPLSHWVVADVYLDNPPAEHERFGRNLRVGTYQVSNVEEDWYRVSIMKVTPPIDRSQPVTLEELQQAMIEGIGTDFGLRSARWMSRFGDGFRQVTKYRYQRVFLLGDAAHTHSPIGGQGLNLGIQDAMNLGWKLGLAATNKASDKLLDTFEEERHPVGAAVLQMAKAQTALIKPGSQIEALRAVVGTMLQVPEVTLHLSKILSGLGVRYAWGEGKHLLVGQRIPNLKLLLNNTETGLFALMHKGRPLLLNFEDKNNVEIPEAYKLSIDVINAVPKVKENNGMWSLPAIGEVPAIKSVFIRPDGFVAWVQNKGEEFDIETLSETLNKWLDND